MNPTVKKLIRPIALLGAILSAAAMFMGGQTQEAVGLVMAALSAAPKE